MALCNHSRTPHISYWLRDPHT